MRSRVFIGSANESLTIAHAVHARLGNEADSETWEHGTFSASTYPVEALLAAKARFDFGVFICEGLDRIETGEPDRFAVRDNVVFELGMFISALGTKRNFLLVPRESHNTVKLPSDLMGITFEYFRRSQDNHEAAVQTACDHILDRIRHLGPVSAGSSRLVASSPGAMARYLGCGGDPATVIAHCDHQKWGHHLLLAPGSMICKEVGALGETQPILKQLSDPPTAKMDWDAVPACRTVFLVDSPYFNPYSRHVLDCYQRHVTRGAVSYSIAPPSNEIRVGGVPYRSNKHAGFAGQLLGRYTDYVLLMRLPGEAAEFGDPNLRVVWLMYGLTTKGSHAGACQLRVENFGQFEEWLRGRTHAPLPEFFEAVFRVTDSKERVEAFKDLEVVHFARLQPHREHFTGDPIPPQPERFFVRTDGGGIAQADAPICSTHLDLVAGCNFKCPTCIESEARDRNLCLSLRKVCRILVDLRRAGCHDLRFYGGEPTLHPDFPEVVETASELGFDMTLVTNGSRLHESAIASALKSASRANRMHVRVSLDAGTLETHASHHGCSRKEFPRIVKAMTTLIEAGVPVSVSYLLTSKSVFELEDACDFWYQKAEAFMPRIVMTKNGKWLAPKGWAPFMIKPLLDKYQSWMVVPPWFKEWVESKGKLLPLIPHAKNQTKLCYVGAFRLVISPHGDSPVESSRESRSSGMDPKLTMTDGAWISVCPYFRYEKETGCEYPPDFAGWCREKRTALLSTRAATGGLCDDVVCSRAELNRKVESALQP